MIFERTSSVSHGTKYTGATTNRQQQRLPGMELYATRYSSSCMCTQRTDQGVEFTAAAAATGIIPYTV